MRLLRWLERTLTPNAHYALMCVVAGLMVGLIWFLGENP